MMDFTRALSAEILKTKRTLTLALAFLAPLALAFLELGIGSNTERGCTIAEAIVGWCSSITS